MREILFKAKRKNWRELPKEEWWVEGYYCYFMSEHCILPKNLNTDAALFGEQKVFIVIDPGTLCQYTGLKDKDGNRIWENDIVKHEISDTIGTVKWYQEDYVGWCVDDIVIDEQQFTDEMWNECEVIGNVFGNPELMKGDAE